MNDDLLKYIIFLLTSPPNKPFLKKTEPDTLSYVLIIVPRNSLP